MAYVPVPKDLTKVKTKVALNLTKRQLIFFSIAAIVGVPLYLLAKKPLGSSVSAILMVTVMLPFFFMAMYEKDGLPFEKVMGNIIRQEIPLSGETPVQDGELLSGGGFPRKEGRVCRMAKKKKQAQQQCLEAAARKNRQERRKRNDKKEREKEKLRKKQEKERKRQKNIPHTAQQRHSLSADVCGWHLPGIEELFFQNRTVLRYQLPACPE